MDKKGKAEQPIEAALVALRAELAKLQRKAIRAPIAELTDAARNGQELVVVKGFKSGDKRHEPGDRIRVSAEDDDWLFRHGFVNTIERVEAGRRHQKLSSFYRDELAGWEMRYNDAARNEQMAVMAVKNAEAMLTAARDAVEVAKAQRAAKEADLRASLEQLRALDT